MNSWDELHLRDLFYAYRKAKADRFYETSIRSAEKFIQYEQNLSENLQTLLFRLQEGEISEIVRSEIMSVDVLPKKTSPNTHKRSLHAHWSSFERERENWPTSSLQAEFRFVGDFSVNHHILSALWINLVGHKYDEILGPSAIASRLRRYRPSGNSKNGEFHLDAIGSFEPYFKPYRDWRDGGLEALNRSLRDSNDVAAITLDISNFYHSVDPAFATNDGFLKNAKIQLSDWELFFTNNIIDMINLWNLKCSELMRTCGCKSLKSILSGLPIGLSASRLLSNVVLFFLDRDLERNLSPIYYSRYVDDIFLVINDKSKFSDQYDFIKFLGEKVPCLDFSNPDEKLIIDTPNWAMRSKLFFSKEKLKIFFLSGKSGLDLLESISEQIKSVSSERRLMPSVLDIRKLGSAKILANGSSAADEVDALRKADGLTLRRLGWSILLRSLSVLAKDLEPDDWIEDRKDVYRFACDHVIRADKILEYLDKIPWLFTIAISVRDYPEAQNILFRTRSALREIKYASSKDIKINGIKGISKDDVVWSETDNSITKFFREALVRSYDFRFQDENKKSVRSILSNLNMTSDDLKNISINALGSDWARIPYRYAQETHLRKEKINDEDIIYSLYSRIEDLQEFLSKRKMVSDYIYDKERYSQTITEESLIPYLFPTRPYLTEEIALLTPDECVYADRIQAARNWSRYVRALRGIWTKPDDLSDLPITAENDTDESDHLNDSLRSKNNCNIIDLGAKSEIDKVRIGISSLGISEETWNISASGTNDLSPERYDQIQEIVNQALRSNPRPDYLILPELALPARWISTVSQLLRQSGISLISGIDYAYPDSIHIYSSAVMALSDDRLGYPSTIQIRQPKCEPAPHEDMLLQQTFGRNWFRFDKTAKPIYNHRGFHFAVLVCSELSNVDYRRHAQGNVDALFVLSWNQDLETFSALTESAALDVHCYIALCNNRVFGDSRVRAPMKNSWLRDVCRLRGGLNNHLVVVEVDVMSLRRHQSRATRWPQPNDVFKPIPEGFKPSASRRTNPA